MKSVLFVDDFREWTGDLRLTDGRMVTAIALSGSELTTIPKGHVGNGIAICFDRETGTALGGEQLHPEEMYRVRPETYLRRGAGKAAYMAYAATVGVSYPYEQIPPDRRQIWGEAMMGVGVYAGRMLYDEFCDLHCGNLQGHKFLHWSALRADERAGWDAAVLAGGEHLAMYRKPANGGVVPGPYGKPSLVICGGGDGPGLSLNIPVTIKEPTAAEFAELIAGPPPPRIPEPCLDPTKMHGWCDQQGGSDFPDPDPNPR